MHIDDLLEDDEDDADFDAWIRARDEAAATLRNESAYDETLDVWQRQLLLKSC
eukprot:m.213102 g.213102  ORF g.213102 m.213102 type:complete len:53 (-) comp10759_c0_seq3:1731-1889(-)